jgi:hypothetical protein
VTIPNIALYAGAALAPAQIVPELPFMAGDGFTTIILGMFHIGNPVVRAGTHLGDIIFNDNDPIVIRDGKYISSFPEWPGNIAKMKASGAKVTQIYASFGGARPWVKDFETIKQIYDDNNNSFSGTQLEKNLQIFRATFPAIDGIDMDCEETYDVASFVAFCKMLIRIGFHITFCPYEIQDFWTEALVQIENSYPLAVKWWNLQCYDGGGGNDPQNWAAAIATASPGRQIENYIMAGDWVRFYDDEDSDWSGHCPTEMEQLFSTFSNQSCVGGGFIWSLDLIRDSEKRTPTQGNGCGGSDPIWAKDYIRSIEQGLHR